MKWTTRYLSLAREVSQWSKDPSRKIGAVAIGSSGQVLSQGYNGFPRGIRDSDERYNNREIKYKFVVHAEMNCIYNATMNGVSLAGSKLYVWGLPICGECAKGVLQVGIKEVYWTTDQEIPPIWAESLTWTEFLLNEAGIQLFKIEYEDFSRWNESV